MSDQSWDKVRELYEGEEITLGPYYGHQVRRKPRHLLFTLARYKFAAKLLPQDRPVRVLEVGCSEGVGTVMLTEQGHNVTGVDENSAAIDYAAIELAGPKLKFLNGNFIEMDLGKFDAAVSLDVIEHINSEHEAAFMEAIRKHLNPEGMCVIGTPNDHATQYASPESQAGHVNMFTAERLDALLRRYFSHVFVFGMNDEIVHTGFYPMCHYLMALACSPRR